jgi:hypothetical protein
MPLSFLATLLISTGIYAIEYVPELCVLMFDDELTFFPSFLFRSFHRNATYTQPGDSRTRGEKKKNEKGLRVNLKCSITFSQSGATWKRNVRAKCDTSQEGRLWKERVICFMSFQHSRRH